jgi:uncharacterized protein YcaQ
MRKERVGVLLADLAAEGELREVEVEGWPAPAYVHPARLDLAERAAAGDLRPSLTTLLSPFDPLVWHRERASAVFDFDYKIECYTPAPARKYGYFVLPILHRGELVGRLDAKAHRREGRFEVRALYLEPGVVASDLLVREVGAALAECADWHGTPSVEVATSEPTELAPALVEAASAAGATAGGFEPSEEAGG